MSRFILTEDNADKVVSVHPEQVFKVLPDVFRQLVEPGIKPMVQYHHCKAIQSRLVRDRRPEGHMSFDSFGQACFESGIVKTMLTISRDFEGLDQWSGLAAFFGLDAIWHLMRTGTSSERRELLEALLKEGVVELCLEKIRNAELAIIRSGAVQIMRCLSTESFLAEYLSAEQTSEVLTTLCNFMLEGPNHFIEQFGNPSLTFQSFLCFGKFGAPRSKAATYAPRWYAMSQENAAWAIQGLFLRCPPPSQSLCAEILRHDPAVLDLLFEVGGTKRSPWYAESAATSVVCEAIVLMFRTPDFHVPGIETKPASVDVRNEGQAEWDAVLESVKLLADRPNWVKSLLGVWHTLEDERPRDIMMMMTEAPQKYHAVAQFDEQNFLRIFDHRGSSRIVIERLIATITHIAAESPEKLTESDLLSLLRVTNAACRNPITIEQVYSQDDKYLYCETTFELFRKPLYAIFTEDEVEPPLQIANEPYIGPTAHARVLKALADRRSLQTLPRLAKLPKEIGSRMTLAQLKQIGTSDSIKRFLITARKRVTARKEIGNKRFKADREFDFACAAFVSGAELATALIAFDDATKGIYGNGTLEGVRRELVLCLGNAAEMALGMNKFKNALYYAECAVDAVGKVPTVGGLDAVDQNIRDKNLRRVERARAGLQA